MSRFVLRAALVACCLAPTAAFAQTGGPDAYGYTYTAVVPNFIPLSGDPMAVAHPIIDDGEFNVTAPVAINFYGVDRAEATIGDNGGIRFAHDANITFFNQSIPSTGATQADLAVFHDDIDCSAAGFLYTLVDAVNLRYIASWEDCNEWGETGDASFQAHLYFDGRIEFHYLDVDFGSSMSNGGSATIGIQDLTGGTNIPVIGGSLEVSYNDTTFLTSAQAVAFIPPVYTDADGDGFTNAPRPWGGDCDDANGAVNPGADEVCGNLIDDDCNNDVDTADADSDTYDLCVDDCNDDDTTVNPGATEVCNGSDDNCDTVVPTDEVEVDGDGVLPCNGDCDDTNAAVSPQLPEDFCDPLDNECGGNGNDAVGDLPQTINQPITDNIDPNYQSATFVIAEAGAITDLDVTVNLTHTWLGDMELALISPEGTRVVLMDEQTANSDNLVNTRFDDEAAAPLPTTAGGAPFTGSWRPVGANLLSAFDGEELSGTWTFEWQDDGGGDTGTIQTVTLHASYTSTDADTDGVSAQCGDCNDNDAAIFPGQVEACDGTDVDCDGAVEADADADTFWTCMDDCDDADAMTYPGAPDTCDGSDTDCDGTEESDADSDTVLTCDGDCDDDDAATYPGAAENCDGVDSACDGGDEGDVDTDGSRVCDGDCNDADAAVLPGATETCDGIDSNCDGSAEIDVDSDTYLNCVDCVDTDATIYPGAAETCDGVDSGCDGGDESDVDVDGVRGCAGDCNDTNNAIYPGATENCDGTDSACDGLGLEVDADTDGVLACANDCNDNDATVRPGAVEACDGIDSNCDGGAESDGDTDGFFDCGGDCNDADATINPSAVEGCDGIDNNCDTNVDESGCGDDDDDDSVPGDDDSAPGDDDSAPGDDDSAPGDDDDSTPGDDDDSTPGDDDDSTPAGDDDSAAGDGADCEDCSGDMQGGGATRSGAVLALLAFVTLRRRNRR